MNEVLIPVLEKFELKVNDILRLRIDFDLVAPFIIVIEIHKGLTPALVISSRASKLATEIGADFDIDLYSYPYNKFGKE